MSRVGKNPVAIPQSVDVSVESGLFSAKGKGGEQSFKVMDFVTVTVEDGQVFVKANSDAKKARQAWGTMRSLINNAVKGVSEGFVRKLEVNGVGYRAQVQGKILRLQLGFSHDVNFKIPDDVKIVVEGDRNNIIAVSGVSRQRVGQIASNIRSFRPPEPYKGKGVKYTDEVIIRKEGKKK